MLHRVTEGDHSRVIIHIDIDCFYAQVEMIRDPSLKDKPLGMALSWLHDMFLNKAIYNTNMEVRIKLKKQHNIEL